MTDNQLRQKLLRDEDLTPEEVEDIISERAEAQFDDWKDAQLDEPFYSG